MTVRAKRDTAQMGWQAELMLGLAKRGDKTVLAQRRQRGPLAVQRPFYPEGAVCHLYLLHPPGGVVGGDQLSISTTVAQDAAAVVTTPGATKFYRSAGANATQKQQLQVAAGASLEWLPQENIFFPGALATIQTEIHLTSGAHFFGWEMHCLGRPANRERFDSGRLEFQLNVFRDDTPWLLERFLLTDPAELDALSGLRGFPVFATLLANDVDQTLLEQMQSQFGHLELACIGFTLLDDLLICRYLGESTEQARQIFIQIWQTLRPHLIQRAVCMPRIWAT